MVDLLKLITSMQFVVGVVVDAAGMFIFKPVISKLIGKLLG